MEIPDIDESNTPSDEDSAIALQDAIDNDHCDLARKFLSSDVSLDNHEIESGFTPVESTKLSSEDMIDVFIDAGINIDWQDGQGLTLTHLVARGAEITLCDNEYLGLLDYVALGKQVEIKGFLLGKGCSWDRMTLKQLLEDDTSGTRNHLLADLARIEASKALAELDNSRQHRP